MSIPGTSVDDVFLTTSSVPGVAPDAVIAAVLLLWVGQDLTYSPGWAHPMAYYFFLALILIAVFGITGLMLRRGTPRID